MKPVNIKKLFVYQFNKEMKWIEIYITYDLLSLIIFFKKYCTL